MNRFISILLLTLFVSVGLWAGCGEKKETKVTSTDVKKEVKEAVNTARAYTQQQKEDYQKQIEGKIRDYDQKLEELKVKAKEVKGETKAEFNRQMDQLRKKKEEASQKLKEMKSATGQAWEDLKSGAEAALDDLEKTFNQMVKRFG
jgi:TolA-binding protein